MMKTQERYFTLVHFAILDVSNGKSGTSRYYIVIGRVAFGEGVVTAA